MGEVTPELPNGPAASRGLLSRTAPYLGAAAALVAVAITGVLITTTNATPSAPPLTFTPGPVEPTEADTNDTPTTTVTRLGGFFWNVPNGPGPLKRDRIVAAMAGDRGVTAENPWVITMPETLPAWVGAPVPEIARLQIWTSGAWTGRRAWLYLLERGDERPPLVIRPGPLDPEDTSVLAARFETEPASRSCLEAENPVAVARIRGRDACIDEWGHLVWEEAGTLITVDWRDGTRDDVAAWLHTWGLLFSNGARG